MVWGSLGLNRPAICDHVRWADLLGNFGLHDFSSQKYCLVVVSKSVPHQIPFRANCVPQKSDESHLPQVLVLMLANELILIEYFEYCTAGGF